MNLKLFAALVVITLLNSCGGGSSTTTPSPNPGPAQPQIPTTIAKTPSVAPTVKAIANNIPQVQQAILRHVHRNSLGGLLIPSGDFEDSPNAKVDRLSSIGLYREVQREADKSYKIEPANNGLSYFRVTNTKPNGSVRVHNFHGVPSGHYMTLDSTDAPGQVQAESKCRQVSVRITNVPSRSNQFRLMFNGREFSNVIYEGTQA